MIRIARQLIMKKLATQTSVSTRENRNNNHDGQNRLLQDSYEPKFFFKAKTMYLINKCFKNC